MGRRGHWIIRQKIIKTLTSRLPRIGPVGSSGWGSRDLPKRRLGTLGDLVQCHHQWSSCIQNLSYSVQFFNLFCKQFFSLYLLSARFCEIETIIGARWHKGNDRKNNETEPYNLSDRRSKPLKRQTPSAHKFHVSRSYSRIDCTASSHSSSTSAKYRIGATNASFQYMKLKLW